MVAATQNIDRERGMMERKEMPSKSYSFTSSPGSRSVEPNATPRAVAHVQPSEALGPGTPGMSLARSARDARRRRFRNRRKPLQGHEPHARAGSKASAHRLSGHEFMSVYMRCVHAFQNEYLKLQSNLKPPGGGSCHLRHLP